MLHGRIDVGCDVTRDHARAYLWSLWLIRKSAKSVFVSS